MSRAPLIIKAVISPGSDLEVFASKCSPTERNRNSAVNNVGVSRFCTCYNKENSL